MLTIINTLTGADLARVHDIETTPDLFAKAHMAGLEGVEFFARRFVNPVLRAAICRDNRERVLVGCYYRLYPYCRSLLKLNEALDFQCVASADRSIIELYMDMELIHQNTIPDGVARVDAFTDAQKLSAARKTVRFIADNPNFDRAPSPYDPLREFVRNHEGRIDVQTERFWGLDNRNRPPEPSHWSDRDLKARAALLGRSFQLLVHEGYDYRNWMIHTGLAGVAGIDAPAFTILCGQSYASLHKCMVGALRILGAELRLREAIEGFVLDLDELDRMPVWALADVSLQSLGEQSRYRLDMS